MNKRDLIFEQYKLIKEAEEQPIMKVDEFGNKFWRLPDDKLHREDGPAAEYANGDKQWWVNGERHRVDRPAIEYANGTKLWYVNGKLHRVDGPAAEYANGDKEWWVNDELHREDGPAIERADGTKLWYVNDKRHRVDGPVAEWANGDKEWWYVNSKRYDTPSDWAEAVFKLHNKPYDQKSIDRFLKSIYSKGLNDLL